MLCCGAPDTPDPVELLASGGNVNGVEVLIRGIHADEPGRTNIDALRHELGVTLNSDADGNAGMALDLNKREGVGKNGKGGEGGSVGGTHAYRYGRDNANAVDDSAASGGTEERRSS